MFLEELVPGARRGGRPHAAAQGVCTGEYLEFGPSRASELGRTLKPSCSAARGRGAVVYARQTYIHSFLSFFFAHCNACASATRRHSPLRSRARCVLLPVSGVRNHGLKEKWTFAALSQSGSECGASDKVLYHRVCA